MSSDLTAASPPEVISRPAPYSTTDPGDVSVLPTREWSPGIRLAFRFMFCFYAAWTVPQLAAALPLVRPLMRHVFAGEADLGVVVTRSVLRWPSPGDQYSDHFPTLAFEIVLGLVAAAIAIAWTALDKRRREYRRASAYSSCVARRTVAVPAGALTTMAPRQGWRRMR
jgi:hypothetical protein